MMTPVTSLTITYDAECGLCTRAKEWIGQQAALVGLEFLATGSDEARSRFPQLPAGELAVVANTGEVWLGDHGWIVCLWALREYRDLAVRLTNPLLSLVAREAFAAVSRNRLALSNLLKLRSDRDLERQLRKVVVTRCQIEPQTGQK
jgi:predicted DCC family thiol-disulfide oxidoreductase YuxK